MQAVLPLDMNYRIVSFLILTVLTLIGCTGKIQAASEGESESSPVADMRVALLGDSMTWIGGDSCQNERGWSNHFKRSAHPRTIDVYARSGATWTNTAATKGDPTSYSEMLDDENVIYSQAVRLIEAANNDSLKRPDLIFIYAGANDAWFKSRRKNIFGISPDAITVSSTPASCTTLASSVELVCKLLSEEFPQARIVLMTPVEMSKTGVARINQVSDIIESVGSRLGLQVLRADRGVDIRHDVELRKHRYTSDGVHTNPAGAQLISEFIISNL